MSAIDDFLAKKRGNALYYKEVIEELLSSGLQYSYADDTLVSILEFIEESGTITEKQMQAIDNIKNKPYEPKYHKRRHR
jgi:hypothetical protein